MIGYSAFFAYAFFWIAGWYMAYDFTQITDSAVAMALTGFPVGILGVLSGVQLKLCEHYFKTGNNYRGNGG